jgi:hypothetical protein
MHCIRLALHRAVSNSTLASDGPREVTRRAERQRCGQFVFEMFESQKAKPLISVPETRVKGIQDFVVGSRSSVHEVRRNAAIAHHHLYAAGRIEELHVMSSLLVRPKSGISRGVHNRTRRRPHATNPLGVALTFGLISRWNCRSSVMSISRAGAFREETARDSACFRSSFRAGPASQLDVAGSIPVSRSNAFNKLWRVR